MLMNGVPATIYGPRAYAVFCEFVTDPETGDERTLQVNGELKGRRARRTPRETLVAGFES